VTGATLPALHECPPMHCIACWQPGGHSHWRPRAPPPVNHPPLCPPCCRYGDGALCSSGLYGKALCERCDNEQQYDMSKCGETSQWWVSTCSSRCRLLHWGICVQGVIWRDVLTTHGMLAHQYLLPTPHPHPTPLPHPTPPSAGWERHHSAKATARSLSWLRKVPRMQGMGLPVGQAPSTGMRAAGFPPRSASCHGLPAFAPADTPNDMMELARVADMHCEPHSPCRCMSCPNAPPPPPPPAPRCAADTARHQ
jgi:hypothetical protein